MAPQKNSDPCRKLKKGKNKKTKDIDWAADEHFDPNRAMVYIEHSEECPVFKDKSVELQTFLQTQIPEKIFQLVRNDNGKQEPRAGAFEISFAQNARTSRHFLWSGIERGPPRRDKFPASYEVFMPEIKKVLKKVYVELIQNDEVDEDLQGADVEQ